MEFILKLLGFGGSSTGGGAQKDTEVMRPIPDVFESVGRNYRFQRSSYHALINIALGQAIIILLLTLGSIAVLATARPVDRFFVAAGDGRISRIVPLDTPIFNNVEMFSRVSDAVAGALTFGYLDYDQRLIEIGPSFAPGVLASIHKKLLGDAGAADVVQKGLVFSTSIPGQGVTIPRQGINGLKIYEWVIQTRLEVTRTEGYGEAATSTMTPMVATVLVQRAKQVEVQRGFIIAALLDLKPLGAPQPVKTPASAGEGGRP